MLYRGFRLGCHRESSAVDDAAKRHLWYDVVPVPEDFVPASGTLWKATQASEEKGRIAWRKIVDQMREAIASELA